jgi:putative component of toxin-antitoxin plasmid stabilization module
LDQAQSGEQHDDFQPLAVGKGVEEIRVTDDSGAHRAIYVARRAGVLNRFGENHSLTVVARKATADSA